MNRVITGIVIVVGIIWGIGQLISAEGNIDVAVSNRAGLSVGDCIKDATGYDEVACSSPNAAYITLSKTLYPDGDDCPINTTAMITEIRDSGSRTYWCLGDI